MNQTPEQIPAEVREIAERLRREIEKDGIGAANSIAIGYIEGAVNPRYHWRTDAERVTYVRTLLAALDLALSPVEPHAPTRVDTEEAARAAFAAGHLEDDDNEWGGA